MSKKPKNKHLDEIPLDNYEEELAEFLEKGELVSDPDFKENKKNVYRGCKAQYYASRDQEYHLAN